MVKIKLEHKTPSLDLVDQVLSQQNMAENGLSYGYCSASNIGHPCTRSLWYGFRWASSETLSGKTLRTFAKGHRAELLMSERLKLVPEFNIRTIDPDTQGQFLKTFWGGHFKCYVDGFISGLLEAPKTDHVWEHKETNQTKFNKLEKLLSENEEKLVLKIWDEIYYSQAIVSMFLFKKTRHFMTVTSDGGASWTSLRTEADSKLARELLEKAKKVFESEKAPSRLSNDPKYYLCNWCQHNKICFSDDPVENPIAFNCRTCCHSTINNKNGEWECEQDKNLVQIIPRKHQSKGCGYHLFNPNLTNLKPSSLEKDSNDSPIQITYKNENEVFVNNYGDINFKKLS